MKNKTAMQLMLEWVRKTLPMDLDTPRMIEDKIESLLPIEKKQIKNSFNEGQNNSLDYFIPYNKLTEAEQYYEETYGK